MSRLLTLGILNQRRPLPVQFFLDTYPGAAAAYSLRKLRAAYNGAAIRVRRSSDNAEQDIGFDANGNLDTTALLAFVGAGDGFITTVYNQGSHPSNLTQSVTTNQFQIVASGVVTTDGGKPAAAGFGKFFNGFATGAFQVYTNVNVFRTGSSYANLQHSVLFNSGNNNRLAFNTTGNNITAFRARAGATYNPDHSGYILSNPQKLIILHNRPSAAISNLFLNGSANGLNPITTGTGNAIDNHTVGNVVDFWQETIEWVSDQGANAVGISNAINAYYNVY